MIICFGFLCVVHVKALLDDDNYDSLDKEHCFVVLGQKELAALVVWDKKGAGMP